MKTVYFMLTRTGTMPSRLIHFFVRGRYTHISLAIHPKTDEFYSFARKRLHNPLCAGFIVENIHTFVFSKYPDCDCAVYAIKVSDEVYRKIESIVNDFVTAPDSYKYNFLGLIPSKIGINYNRPRHFTCSQFVATVLERAGAVELPKPPSLMMPSDFLSIPNISAVYNGKLEDCVIEEYPVCINRQ